MNKEIIGRALLIGGLASFLAGVAYTKQEGETKRTGILFSVGAAGMVSGFFFIELVNPFSGKTFRLNK